MPQQQSSRPGSDRSARFECERATFESNKERLLEFEGQYVVIGGNEVLGTWPNREDALDAAHKQYATAPFMLKKILKEEPRRHFAHDLPR